MREETAKEFLEAFERGCQLLSEATGIKASADDVLRRGIKLLEKAPQNLQKTVHKHGAMAGLLCLPEPSSEERAQLIRFAKSLPYLLRKPFILAGKKLPYERKGGKKPAFNGDPEKERAACEEVGLLLPFAELQDALARIARKNGISPRTMRRAWNRWKASQKAKPARAQPRSAKPSAT